MSHYSYEWSKLKKVEQNLILNCHKCLPVKVGDIAKGLGVLVKSSTLGAGISGEIRLDDNRYVIRVNRHDVKERQRFTVAHEIGHYLLHRDLIGDGLVDDVLYRSKLPSALETEANRLAADILMPIQLIEQTMTELGSKKIEEKIETVSQMAEVSITAMKIRLNKD
ncbi:ImmA/IrrE family metallo-endopeptidase [Paraglaciecola chathamensis]|uniref:ImmA/IrrE family metallo-endopeptidase n=1 Tax=Paraglaciecola chathamensis TaxID=368405 RepID=UPI0027069E6E|nr:ImmA/IrrE family metallo-endopeptidase [Paraglaciecola chathamensis]MDO6840775.1 ImmA/IrrE family metallo-endopeptidase [Paraglaciecola chathamensis]